MFTINTKFDVGEEVYIVKKARKEEKCPACDGAGHKIINGHKFTCVECYGTGKLHKGKKIYKVTNKDKINRITTHSYIENGELKTVIKYKFQDYNEYTDKRLFSTLEEAEEYCKELNLNC